MRVPCSAARRSLIIPIVPLLFAQVILAVHVLCMQEATLWIVPLLLTAAVAVLALSTQCRSAVTWLYASMAIFVGSVGLALTIRSAQYTYTSALSLCTGIGDSPYSWPMPSSCAKR